MHNQPSTRDSSEPLIERVEARVASVTQSLERRAHATRPKALRRRVREGDDSGNTTPRPDRTLAEQSLRQVFRDLGVAYRRYRKQTGTPVVPGLRDAAYSFRAEPSLSTLVAVAAYMDELDLLS